MVKNNKLAELHVIWLDLENACGSLRYQLLEKAMEFFWIPENIKNLISMYFKYTYVRFSKINIQLDGKSWILALLWDVLSLHYFFILVKEMVLHSAKNNINEITRPSMKAFMDDVTSCKT